MTGSVADLPLVTKSGAKASNDALKGKVVALYFSAHWCPPCRTFTPALRKFYETLKANNQPIEIVFVSGDRSENDFKDYFANEHGDWLAVDYNSEDRMSLGKRYQVGGIPSLLIVDGNSECVVPNGREDVARGDPVAAFAAWKKAAGTAGDWRESPGSVLGGSGIKQDAAAMRAARLAALGVRSGQDVHPPAAAVQPPLEKAEELPVATAAPPILEAEAPTALAGSDVNAAAVAQLISMGFPEAQSLQALESANGNVEQAVSLLMEAKAPTALTGSDVDAAAVAQLISMGFPEAQSRQALESANGNVEQAVSLLFG